MVKLIIEAISGAITGFVASLPQALTGAFDGLFVTGTGGEMALTNLASGLLTIVGISLTIAALCKVYHIFSGRFRKSM